MHPDERRGRILELVRQKGFASLPDLAGQLEVSESTVRRDVEHLEFSGSAQRTHGGVFYTGPSPKLPHFDQRQASNWELKRLIAQRAEQLIEEGDTVLLDGDQVRNVVRDDRDPYSVEGRRRNADRMAALCQMLDSQGINVVCCILSIFPEMREANRSRFSKYFEAYVCTPLEVCMQRDRKNIYAPAVAGTRPDVVGIDIQFPEPRSSDLVVDNAPDGAHASALAQQILRAAGAPALAADQAAAPRT